MTRKQQAYTDFKISMYISIVWQRTGDVKLLICLLIHKIPPLSSPLLAFDDVARERPLVTDCSLHCTDIHIPGTPKRNVI